MCSDKLIIEKINNLSEKIDASANHSRMELDSMTSHLATINSNIASLTDHVRVQNGRVGKIESAQLHCPGEALTQQFTKYTSEMKPVYILSTNYKMIAILVLGAALAFRLIDVGFDWLLNLLSI